MDQDKFKLLFVLEEQQEAPQDWISLHQSLLMLFDSPLNHSGHLMVYIKLRDNRLIRMHREVRIPRTFKRFEQLFNNFLAGCDMPVVETKDGPARLLQFAGSKVIQKLLTQSQNYRISNLAPRLRSPDDFTSCIETETSSNGDGNKPRNVAFFVEFGPVDFNILGEGRETEYPVKTVDKFPGENSYSISRYPLSSSLTCAKLTSSFERALDVF